MDMETFMSINWSIMIPEFIILGAALIISIMDLVMPKSVNRRILGWFAFLSILIAMVSLSALISVGTDSILYDTFRLDAFAKAFKLILLAGAALVMLLAIDFETKEGFETYRGEFYYLFLSALLGGMVMSSSGDLITLFVGLELLSISSYILAGMRKGNLRSAEASMKYVINGGISTAITLFGMSYLYGVSGTTNLYELGNIVSNQTVPQLQYITGLSFFILFIGLSFKLATVPFHMWAPDVYEGAPTPVTAFLSIVSKTAGFVLLLRLIITVYLTAMMDDIGFLSIFTANQQYIAVFAALTMIIGNIVALRQSNIKRMLGYSSIAHAGYLLAAVAAFGQYTIEAIWFYFVAYLLMNMGAFAIIQYLSMKNDDYESPSILAGLYRRSPVLAVCMSIFFLSLAGIPGTAGFIGKLNIFVSLFAKEQAHYILAGIMLVTTVISYVYYFKVMILMFMRTGSEVKERGLPPGITLVLWICAAGTLLLGIFPGPVLDFFHSHFAEVYKFMK